VNGPKEIIRFWWESGLSSASRNHLTTFADLPYTLRMFKTVFRDSSRTVARTFSIGGLCSSAGGFSFVSEELDIIKLTKTPLIYSVSRFNLKGLGAFFGGYAHQSPPVAAGLDSSLYPK